MSRIQCVPRGLATSSPTSMLDFWNASCAEVSPPHILWNGLSPSRTWIANSFQGVPCAAFDVLLGRGVPSAVGAALLTPQRSPVRDLGDLNVFALFVGKRRWGIKMSGTRRCEDCRSGGRAAEQHCCGRAGGCFNFIQGPFADRYRMWMQMFFQLMTFGDECTSSRFYPEGMLLRALICYAK